MDEEDCFNDEAWAAWVLSKLDEFNDEELSTLIKTARKRGLYRLVAELEGERERRRAPTF